MCQSLPDGSDISSCTDAAVIVTDISPNNGSHDEVITITGSGFSSAACNNIVQFGG